MDYYLSLEFNESKEPIYLERATDGKETMRDLITDIGIQYSIDVVGFSLNYDGQDIVSTQAPFVKEWLDTRVETILDRGEHFAEENTFRFFVKKWDKPKQQIMMDLKGKVREAAAALKGKVREAAAALESAQAALQAAQAT